MRVRVVGMRSRGRRIGRARGYRSGGGGDTLNLSTSPIVSSRGLQSERLRLWEESEMRSRREVKALPIAAELTTALASLALKKLGTPQALQCL